VYWNGEFIPESEAKLSIYDSALMFADMPFEMTRSFHKKQFKLKEHIERLYASARWLHIPMPLTMEDMEAACLKTVEMNEPAFAEDDEHRLMINVTRGVLGIYQGVAGTKSGTNVIIADFPLRWTVRGMGKLFDEGINAVIPSQRSIPASLLEPKAKTRSRMHLMMANIQASRFQGENNWPLLLDPDGFISEGTGDNFFIVKDGRLVTSEPRNILRGISRDYVMAIEKEFHKPSVERNIEPFDVLEADEAFMTGTPFCILPVTSLDGVPIGVGKKQWMAHWLLYVWGERVGVDIKKQIQDWDSQTKGDVEGISPYQFKETK
jgi:branched-chain amino acid aminotransferase